ncbi:Mth938-like domain-containing protein [Dokdonella koreensis]|uniref:DUF498 domain containing protein n=1 Tax=Dokdonella koreensis DS-123 TaxID=1300342 RepID=A0A160DW74_9GAMM|nr:MTH938/NDUFAF3 family protein [Dokdonella koreensis]ANB18113.1 DUF498 domain containing protein [Dokdonella koreensis DS-123]
MQLIHDRPEGYFFIRGCTPEAVTVIDRELRASFLLAPDAIVEAWPVREAAAIGADAVAALLALQPELVLIGTGVRQVFPPREHLVTLMRRGIGVEVMDNAAAGRTYNLLAAEGRRVVAAFVLPG